MCAQTWGNFTPIISPFLRADIPQYRTVEQWMRYIDHLPSCRSKAGSSPNAQHRSPHPEVELPGDFTTMIRPCRSATDRQLRLSLLSGRDRACPAITGLTDPLPSSPLLGPGPDVDELPDVLRAADVHRRPRLGRADVAVHVRRHPSYPPAPPAGEVLEMKASTHSVPTFPMRIPSTACWHPGRRLASVT